MKPRLAPVAVPLFLELGLGMAVGLAGTAMAARQADAAAAGFALAHQVAAMLFIVLRIVGAGVSVVVAQALGAGRRAEADAVARAVLGASSWVGGACALAALLGAEALMRGLNAPPAVLALAAPLLQWMAPALLLDAWNAAMASVMRAHLRAREVLGVVLAMHALHLALALWWMPRFGLGGFAAALVASRLLGLGLHQWLWRRQLQLKPRAADLWRLPRRELAAVLRIGVPGAAENVAYRLAFVASVAAVGTLGAPALATQAYVLQFNHFTLLAGLAIGLAGEVVVGHHIGSGRLHAAHRLVTRALALGLALSVGVAGAAALAAPWLLRLFTQDPAILAAGATLMAWSVLLEPGRTFNLVVINALRAAGDARFPVAVGAVSMAVVLAGGSWWLGVHLGWGLVGVWIAYAADEWLRGLLMWWRWRRLAWVPAARASRRRLKALQRQAGG
ncbi:MAG: polysaccharide biosynthesis C-terminal domain-containing protein [Burkholderiaceae bacterium]|nr:polysaccharide biosynthesis C-terminal domain-containing protein [Burkholderiaceae bacterium]